MKKILVFLLLAASVGACRKGVGILKSNADQPLSSKAPSSSYLILSNYAYKLDNGNKSKSIFNVDANIYTAGGGSSKITFKIVDETGKVFSPEKLEIVSRDEELNTGEKPALNVLQITDDHIEYDYSKNISFYSDLQSESIDVRNYKNKLYYKIAGKFTKEGKDINIGFSIYFFKRGAYSAVLRVPARHI